MTPSLNTNPLAALTGVPADLTLKPTALPETTARTPRADHDPGLKDSDFSDILQILNISTPKDEATFAPLGQGSGLPPVIATSAPLGPAAQLPGTAGLSVTESGPIPPPAGNLLPPVHPPLHDLLPGAAATGATAGVTVPAAVGEASPVSMAAMPLGAAPSAGATRLADAPFAAAGPPAGLPTMDIDHALQIAPASSHRATLQGPGADAMLSPAGAQTPVPEAASELAKLQKLKGYHQTAGEPLRLAQTDAGPLTPSAVTASSTAHPALPVNTAALNLVAAVQGTASVPAPVLPVQAGVAAQVIVQPTTALHTDADARSSLLHPDAAAATPANTTVTSVANTYRDLAAQLPPATAGLLPAPLAASGLASELTRLQGTASPRPVAGESPAVTSMLADTATVVTGNDDSKAAFALNATTAADKPNPLQAATLALPLNRPAGTPGWDQALGQRVTWMVDNGLNRAELRLDPPHLGSVSVRIAMQDDQAQVMFQAANPAARDLLEAALPRLREMLAEQGLQLGNTDVGDHNGQPATDNSRDRADDGTTPRRSTDPTLAAAEAGAAGELPASPRIGATGHLVIDEFV